MTWVVVPAAGSGSRMRATGRHSPESPRKPHLPIADGTLLSITIHSLLSCNLVSGAMVVLAADDVEACLPSSVLGKPVLHCVGGQHRMDSVINGIVALPDTVRDVDFVAVHDAARPCISSALVSKVVQAAVTHGQGAIAAVPVADTLKREGEDGTIEATVEREKLWQAQTPQVFQRGVLLAALQHCIEHGLMVSDEAMAMEHFGKDALLVSGSSANLKVTRPADLALAEAILQRGVE